MTSTAPNQPATLTARSPARLLPWLTLWLLLALVEIILLANNARLDTQFWLATRNSLPQSPALTNLWRFLRFFGTPWCAATVVIVIFILSRRRFLIVPTVIAATIFAGLIGCLIRITDGRVRPTHTDAANQWILFRGFDLHAQDLSFPSGHATLAFATAAVLVYFFPQSKWLALPLAAACAFSRVAQQAHFYSDIIMGAVLGWTIAWWTAHLICRRFEFSPTTQK